MNMEELMEWELAEAAEVLRENLSKFHITRPGIELRYRGGKPATNRLSYGTALTTF
jgi:hypothetical protein